MEKIKVGVIFGGQSTEHDVSVVSGSSVIKNLNKEKYEIHEIYINEYGKWFEIQNGEKEEIYNLIEAIMLAWFVTSYFKTNNKFQNKTAKLIVFTLIFIQINEVLY